jgi:hypothetical protein
MSGALVCVGHLGGVTSNSIGQKVTVACEIRTRVIQTVLCGQALVHMGLGVQITRARQGSLHLRDANRVMRSVNSENDNLKIWPHILYIFVLFPFAFCQY